MEKEQQNSTKLPEWSFACSVFKGTAEELIKVMEEGILPQEFASSDAVEKFLAHPENSVENQDKAPSKQ